MIWVMGLGPWCLQHKNLGHSVFTVDSTGQSKHPRAAKTIPPRSCVGKGCHFKCWGNLLQPQLTTYPAVNLNLNHLFMSTHKKRGHKHVCAFSSTVLWRRWGAAFCLLTPPDASQPLTQQYPWIIPQRHTTQCNPQSSSAPSICI